MRVGAGCPWWGRGWGWGVGLGCGGAGQARRVRPCGLRHAEDWPGAEWQLSGERCGEADATVERRIRQLPTRSGLLRLRAVLANRSEQKLKANFCWRLSRQLDDAAARVKDFP